jgi:siroheme synthase
MVFARRVKKEVLFYKKEPKKFLCQEVFAACFKKRRLLPATKVFLVGAGPGDPELLTLKAHRLLQAAEVVLHDSLVDPCILAMAPGARMIDVGKRCGRHSASQDEICRLLCAEALAGHRVVRLKGGDPMVFGRATEEMAALAAPAR